MSKIVNISAKVLEIPLKTTWQTSLYATNTRAHCIVRVVTEDGIRGYGEASPAAAFMGETAYTMETVISRYLAPALAGKSVLDISMINDLMDRIIAGNTSAKAAVDIAVHDAAGKALKVPVYALLGGKRRDTFQLVWSMVVNDNYTSPSTTITLPQTGTRRNYRSGALETRFCACFPDILSA